MNKYFIQAGLIFLIIGLFILDKSLASVVGLLGYFSFTIIVLAFIVNIKSHRTFIFEFFIFGLLCDWHNRYLVGVGVLISVVVLYLFYVFKIRFHSNKFFMTLVNIIFVYILALVYFGFSSIFEIRSLVLSLVSTAIISFLWLKD